MARETVKSLRAQLSAALDNLAAQREEAAREMEAHAETRRAGERDIARAVRLAAENRTLDAFVQNVLSLDLPDRAVLVGIIVNGAGGSRVISVPAAMLNETAKALVSRARAPRSEREGDR